jgi:hypothetical protein
MNNPVYTHSWENIMKLDLKETGYENVDWIHLVTASNDVASSVPALLTSDCLTTNTALLRNGLQ